MRCSLTAREKSGIRMHKFFDSTLKTESRTKASEWSVAFLLVAFMVTSGRAQTAPATQPAQEPAPPAASLSTNVDEVSIDLVVHDKKHRPVLDLKPEDFAVSDDGTPVKLNQFRLVQGDGTAGHLVTFVFDRFDGAVARNVKNIAEKMLKVLPARNYQFAVMSIGGRLRLLQSFTEDRTPIEQAITLATNSQATHLVSTLSEGVDIVKDPAEEVRVKASAEAEKNLISVAQKGVDVSGKHVDIQERQKAQMLLKALEDAQLIVQDQHANRALAGLLALVRAQQQEPDRKAIIYFTMNAVMDSASKEMLKTIGGAATKAGVTIYTVDMDAMNLSGRREVENAMLNGQPAFNPTRIATSPYTTITPMQQEGGAPIAGTPSMQGPVWGPAQTLAMATDFMRGNNEDPNRYLEIKSPMSDLSKNTGGLYIDAQLSIKGPLNQMVQDMSTYYEASYVPPPQDYDGKFRPIEIKPLKAGLLVQAKTGYFSLPPGSATGLRPFEASLLKSLNQEQLPSDFKFNASILRFGNLPDGNTNSLAVEVPFSGLNIKEDTHTNLYSARVAVVAQVKDSGGTVIEHFGEEIARRGALETLDRDKSLAVTMERHFMEIPGKYTLEVAVKDENGDKLSAERVPFEIPALPSGPSLSDMVLVRKMDTFNPDADPLEPMRYESAKVTPNLSGTVPHDEKSVSLFLLLHPDAKATDPPTLEMQVIRNGKAGRQMPLPMKIAAKDAVVPYLATFQTKSLAPGDYKVKATMTQGGEIATQEIAFTVEGQPGDGAVAAAQGHGGNGAPADEPSPTLEIATDVPGQLAITSSANPLPPPTADEVQALIGDARDRAVGYKDTLPNFMCIEVINRSYDMSGTGNWKHRDTIRELLRYREKQEAHTVMEINGEPAASPDPAAIKGATSTGEFGGVLDAVFSPNAKAEFKWKETDALGNGTVQVFDYKVAKENSSYSVRGANGLEPTVAFHGKVYIDTATRSVRRVTLIADGLPKDFPTHASAISVDYDYVSINSHDYLVPISAEVSLLEGRREAEMNTVEFRDYRKFGSNVKILDFRPLEKP